MLSAQRSFDQLAGPIKDLVKLEDDLSAEAYRNAESNATRSRLLVLLVAALSTAAAVAVTLLVRKVTFGAFQAGICQVLAEAQKVGTASSP